MEFQVKKNIYSHLTAIKRSAVSFPTRFLLGNGYLHGHILDFGCGHGFDAGYLKELGLDVYAYDKYYAPDYPNEKFDVIICHYVLNVLEPEEQTEVLLQVSELLKPGGTAYFTVRRDIAEDGFRFNPIYKVYTYQCNVKLPYTSLLKNEHCEIYAYKHYNQLLNHSKCPFCNLSSNINLLCESATAVAFFDGYPVSKGHVLVIPKRHVADYFELTEHEQRALWMVVNHCKKFLDLHFHPDGYNVGINDGLAAGQSVFHVHIHLIPRYNGDVDNPKGGVRGVIPNKQKY